MNTYDWFWEMAKRDGLFNAVSEEQISDDKDVVTVSLDLPGHDPKRMKIDVNDQILTVESERDGKLFTKRYRLADSLDLSNITATSENGVLTLTIPKRADSRRTIKVQMK